jgi:hypothetical protein
MKRHLIAFAAIAATGCVTIKPEINDPSVAARFDSSKSPAEFARCAAEALGPSFALEQNSQAFALIRKRGIVLDARWDIFRTNNGSQAELRNGSDDDAGASLVAGCA